jgi:hypothetical protein
MANPCGEIDAVKQSETFLRDLSTGKALLLRKVIFWSEITKGSIRSLIVNTGSVSE